MKETNVLNGISRFNDGDIYNQISKILNLDILVIPIYVNRNRLLYIDVITLDIFHQIEMPNARDV